MHPPFLCSHILTPEPAAMPPSKEKWCMNLIELKWNGFLHPFAFKFERHKKWEGGEDTYILVRPTQNLVKGGEM